MPAGASCQGATGIPQPAARAFHGSCRSPVAYNMECEQPAQHRQNRILHISRKSGVEHGNSRKPPFRGMEQHLASALSQGRRIYSHAKSSWPRVARHGDCHPRGIQSPGTASGGAPRQFVGQSCCGRCHPRTCLQRNFPAAMPIRVACGISSKCFTTVAPPAPDALCAMPC